MWSRCYRSSNRIKNHRKEKPVKGEAEGGWGGGSRKTDFSLSDSSLWTGKREQGKGGIGEKRKRGFWFGVSSHPSPQW